MIRVLRAKFSELGPLRLVGAAYRFLVNSGLQKIYRFEPWHVHGNYFSRPYKARVIGLASFYAPATVVEIGCGLGDIIGRIKSSRRVGIDLDPSVLAAAQHCVPGNVELAVANFLEPDSVIAALDGIGRHADPIKAIDCLILVNWIHMFEIGEIAAAVSRIAEVYPIGFLVVDAIKPDQSGYRHHHNADDFGRIGEIVKIVDGDAARDLILIRYPRR